MIRIGKIVFGGGRKWMKLSDEHIRFLFLFNPKYIYIRTKPCKTTNSSLVLLCMSTVQQQIMLIHISSIRIIVFGRCVTQAEKNIFEHFIEYSKKYIEMLSHFAQIKTFDRKFLTHDFYQNQIPPYFSFYFTLVK